MLLPLGAGLQHIPRLLTFDLLVLDGENIMQKPLMKRYGVRATSSVCLG